MAERARVTVYYSLQSDYCYFLLDRLLGVAQSGIDVDIRPILGGVLRTPELFAHRSSLEQAYFKLDTQRTADVLGLPYAYPNPSPITFKPGLVWIAEQAQPLNERLYRLFVGALRAGHALDFLDSVGRMLWNGSVPNWAGDNMVQNTLDHVGLIEAELLQAPPWVDAKAALNAHALAIQTDGHWGVPLMIYDGEPFYGQDRFDHLIWRLKERRVLR